MPSLALDGNRNKKMARCLELEAFAEEEVLSVIFPTIAYMEDVFAGKQKTGRPARIWLCGFGASSHDLAERWSAGIADPV